MSWLKNLHTTYENCFGKNIDGDAKLMPICHTKQNAQIEVTIDGDGNFRRASVIESGNATLVPCTEASAGRSGKQPTNHPLCDKLQYLAGDFNDYGGDVTSGFSKEPSVPFEKYMESLSAWCESRHSNRKVEAIFKYVSQKTLVKDLVNSQLIPLDPGTDKELKEWTGEKEDTPLIFKALPNNYSPLDAFVRWNVEIPGEPSSGISQDQSVIASWIGYYCSLTEESRGTCFITGQDAVLASKHPSKIRHASDKAKLISGNDGAGFTFRGRFTDKTPGQAANVSFDVSQKAHNALRWLIERQGYRNGDLVYVAWPPNFKDFPDPFVSTSGLFGSEESLEPEGTSLAVATHDVGQHFATQLNKAISGYRSKLTNHDSIVLLGIDSATPGRLSIILQRNISGSDFLQRIENWHSNFAWPQNYSKKQKFVGAPSPEDITKAAFGTTLEPSKPGLVVSEKLKQACIQRLVLCIVDGSPIPKEFVLNSIQRVTRRLGVHDQDWEKALGIACALYRGFSLYQKKEYEMSLDPDNCSRDYLYGRLLALADSIEGYALKMRNGKKRDTAAKRFTQRFSERPFSTWPVIYNSLQPYMSQLRSSPNEKSVGFLVRREKILDEVMTLFLVSDFTNDKNLTGEFLLGYHCQRSELWGKPVQEEKDEN